MAADYNSFGRQSRNRGNLETQRVAYDDYRRLQQHTTILGNNQNEWIAEALPKIDAEKSLRYRVQLSAPEDSIWVNGAQQRAQQAYRQGRRIWHHQFMIGVTNVTTDLRGRSVDIRIVSGGLYFEFETSGKPVVLQDITQEGISFPDVYTAAVVSVNLDGGVAKPTILGGARQANTAAVSKLRKYQQINLIDEPVTARPANKDNERTKPKHKYQKLLYESWAPNHPFTGVFTRAYNMEGRGAGLYYGRGSLDAHLTRDISYDVPYADSTGVNPLRPAILRGDADWPRASGVQTVKSDLWGTREFAIYFDAFNQVSVFPTSMIQPLNPVNPYLQNVPSAGVIMVPIPLPSWVFKPTMKFEDFYASVGSIGDIEFPEIDWKMHPDGTKACAVVHERQAASFDATYYAVDQGSSPMTSTAFNNYRDTYTGVMSRHNAFIDPTNLPQRYCIGVGLVEINLIIMLHGPNPEDFTFAIDLTELRRPTTNAYCTMLAGYVWYDIESDPITIPKTYRVDRGDLIAMDIERWYKPTTGNAGSFLSLKNLTKNTELLDVGGDVVDYDLTTASFVLNVNNLEFVNRTLALRPGAPGGSATTLTYTIEHQGVAIIVMGKLRKMLFPDTIPDEQRDIIIDNATFHPRQFIEDDGGWEYMPMNDMRDWTDTALANLRLYYAVQFGYKTGSPTAIPTALSNWWVYGMKAYFPPTGLITIALPRFGWYVYADEIMNRMQISPRSTFFTHPSGTWAFFDHHSIYNPYGMYGPLRYQDALTPAIAEMELEHVIYDAVHLESKSGSVNTSFIALYNQAVVAGYKDGTLTEPFETISKADLRATFTKERFTHATGIQWLQLKCEWYPNPPVYYFETGYQGGAYTPAYDAATDAGGLIDLTFGSGFYSAPAYGGTFLIPSYGGVPVKFSSCAMVT